ncbi:hypothetical protein NC652_021442 [Populus alba x Populus x berolinensis]|nr:hypothetical protein NC652_021442 [Populus alba x Populus x berolinensis]
MHVVNHMIDHYTWFNKCINGKSFIEIKILFQDN